MLKFIMHSFTFSGIFQERNRKKSVVIFYFIILIFVTSFPLNLQIIRNNGWEDLNTLTLAWREHSPSWLPNELPNDVVISQNGLYLPFDRTYCYETVEDGVTSRLVINPMDQTPIAGEIVYTEEGIKTLNEQGEVVTTAYEKTVLLCKDKIVYHYQDNNVIVGSYKNVNNPIQFSSLKSMDKSEASSILLSMIDNSFSSYMIFSNILINTGTQLLLNLSLVLIISAIFLLIRVKYQKITTYSQNINIIVASMTIPSIISFVIGVIGIIEINAFSVVLFQLFTPLIALGAVYKGSKVKDPNIKYTA